MEFHDDYHQVKPLGQGTYESVILCQNKATGENFACKILKKGGIESIQKEIDIMQDISGHLGVVALKEVYEDIESFYLVMELCSGGSLLDQMPREGSYSEMFRDARIIKELEEKVARIIKELMLAVGYCHEMGVVHRDIKPESILFTASGQLKLADFGLAERFLDGQSLTRIVGSPAYMAPEVFAGKYSEKVDIWSASVLLHELLIGVRPFHGGSWETMSEAIKNDKLEFTGGNWKEISQSARDLLSKMLTRDISTRFTANDVLRHPWISDGKDSGLICEPEPKRRCICRPSADGQGNGFIGALELKRSMICIPSKDGKCGGLIDRAKTFTRLIMKKWGGLKNLLTLPSWVKQISTKILKADKKTVDLVGNEEIKANTNVRHFVLPCSVSARTQLIPDIIRCYSSFVYGALRRFLPEDKVESIKGLSLTADGRGAVFDVTVSDMDISFQDSKMLWV